MYRRFSALTLLGFILGLALASVSEAALVGWWKFDEGSGTVAKDSSGLHHDGTVINPDWVTGHYGGALNFTGTNYVDVPAESWSTIRTQATVCFWAYGDPAQQPQANFIFGAFSDPANNEARRMSAHVPWSNGNIYFDTGGPGYNRINQAGNASDYEGTWTFWTFLKNADTGDQQIYINGVLWLSGTGMTNTMEGVTKFTIGTKPSLAEGWYRGMIDDFRLYDEALSVEQILEAMTGRGPAAGTAADPGPADQTTDVLREMDLTWTAGEFANTHDIYLGTAFDDVNEASRTSPKGVLASQGQAATTYDAGRLEFGRTYYWRVDEVNAPPDSTIFKGTVWSFTVEPYSYPIANVTATASSASSPEMSPLKTVDGSGLTGDLHDAEPTHMWLSAASGPQGAWIQYALERAYKLDQMKVWNSNQLLESFLGFGAKGVTAEYSVDGADWKTLGDFEFARAPGAPNYAANTAVDFAGAIAQHVKLTIKNNWGGVVPQYGLSEVRFYAVPVAAREPSPATGAPDIAPQVTLSWRAGREADSHQVFLGTDANNLPLAATVKTPSYEADVNLDQTYFWKVVEVNEAEDPAAWPSDVWSFATVPFFTVDDFEGYGADLEAMNTVFDTWVDGFSNPAQNGSVVGLATAVNGTFCDTAIFHGGKASMPFAYDNTTAPLSEAVRTFDPAQDWTKHGYKTLALSFYGDPDNTGTLYLKINGTKVPYNGKTADLKRTQWQPWNIDLAATGANLKSVTKLALGIDGAGAVGILRLDDLCLYPTAGEMITPVDPGKTGLVAWYKFDGDFKDSAGANAGTARGDAKIATDPVRGQVLSLDGVGDAVAVPKLGSGNTLTIAMWVNTAVDPVPIQFESFFHANGWEAGDLHWRYSYGKVDSGINGVASGNLTGVSIAGTDQWNHVAVTVSPTTWTLWLNGFQEATRDLPAPATVTLGEGLIGAWLGTDGVTVSRAFTGTMDDARFYNRALSAEEIAFLAGRTEPFAKPF
jgi:hypothetical protein